jgi:hypothetical protein
MQQIHYQGSFSRVGTLQIRKTIIHTVNYAHELVLLAKEEIMLQDLIDRLTEIGRCYAMIVKNKK